MAAIELASTEGFTRSAADVSLRRLAYYSLSPVMKSAFEQVYGAPFLARLLFAEVGANPDDDLFLRIEYDGAIATNGGDMAQTRHNYAVLSANQQSTDLMETFLNQHYQPNGDLRSAVSLALDAWSVGHLALGNAEMQAIPEPDEIGKHRQEQLATVGIEAAILERGGKSNIRYRNLSEEQVRPAPPA
jgi:proteasome alpha subunit